MQETFNWKGIKLETPATYRIVVQGCLDQSWSDRLAGMAIVSQSKGKDAPVTTLTGRLRDQAELSGVLNSLYELHLPILKVEMLERDE
ncbi:MAG: hypothetical protein C4532_16170 [Candidatus Abyssobacteria bacterium SURF_17]|uniref:Uncharacterized protein n=1 Tax=Candidatus Abyssobacteria bacterium SURF_17 TaxID=2093361 RepID=A0A419ES21_9BACT|nr:MAG: hypothetical protein C4532_16170 [Candidatus Abyssubacteria bacterium SURF_17]